ncbi:hypothetical protein LXL04_023389 [Taraxacum kok-saghyz]
MYTYFTVEKFKVAYALEIAPMPGKNQWMHMETIEKNIPTYYKTAVGKTQKKKRTEPRDEPKKRHRCPRCGIHGHHERTCKNPVSQASDHASTGKKKEHKRA